MLIRESILFARLLPFLTEFESHLPYKDCQHYRRIIPGTTAQHTGAIDLRVIT